MSTMSYALRDSTTMVRRRIKHMRRYPSLTIQLVGLPVVFLLLFVYVFGGTLGDGLGAGSGGRSEYVAYVTPGIILMAVAMVAMGTAVSVAMDMMEGVVARFKTMAIARVSVLTGHVVAAMLQTFFAVAVVLAVAFAIGFRSDANVVEWFAAAGVLAMLAFALTWLTVAMGLVAKTIDSASNMPQPLVFLPLLGSGFVPTDSMPAGLRWFADYQPFTPVIETLRGLLLGTGIGANGFGAVAWSAGIALVGYLWARKLYNRQD
ncbi:ABC transporter permease [Phytohabitans aurantiacus]|jgi:ABC-2 type transport system permease protein|uniref:Transport permease protein n=1 Tax=Phytohabitans aurantiacus TaxID=3016789 RepID=A0ABQ5QPG2_9ACTN|nr:ABC transporter permease [Phytohabitans aurantiacus]GLH96294.1 transport permease protein [Phytohabitans aurantiacus]